MGADEATSTQAARGEARKPWWRRSLPATLAIAAVVATMATRSLLEQHAAYDRAVAAEAAGSVDDAIVEYRWVLRWTTPIGLWDGDAVAALERIAADAAANQPERAAFALDALRSGAIASRWLLQPHADALARANAQLPGLLARVAERRGDTRGRDELLRRFGEDVARPVGVPGWLALLVALGFALWVYGTVQLVARGVDDEGRLVAGAARWMLAAACGLVVWAGALWLG